jgi:NAD(P)-dependent dehydrogenase (short-subunit alcohol dehydrogenase family)
MKMSTDMKGKIVLITGATSGIGRQTAIALAGMGAKVVVLARSEEKGAEMVKEIREGTGNSESDIIGCDLASFDSVRRAATEFRSRYQRLDVLIDNAGLIIGKREVTVDGFEQTFQVNHLSHFLLTNLLLDVLKNSAPSRIVIVGSEAHEGAHLDLDDLMLEKGYSAFKAYGRSKLANLLFCFELARRLEGSGVTANCLHPGVVRTHFGRGLGGMANLYPVLYPFMKSARKGAVTTIYLASSPEVANISGKYFSRKKVRSSSKESMDKEIGRRLWEKSAKLTGLEK